MSREYDKYQTQRNELQAEVMSSVIPRESAERWEKTPAERAELKQAKADWREWNLKS